MSDREYLVSTIRDLERQIIGLNAQIALLNDDIDTLSYQHSCIIARNERLEKEINALQKDGDL